MSDRNKPVDYLKQYLGIKEGSDGHKAILKVFNDSGLCSRYKMTTSDPWCATAVSAAFIASGLTKIFPCVECSCGAMITKAKNANIWVENDAYVPSVGDVIMYDWNDSGYGDDTNSPDHVGIVVSVSGKTIKVIEGNKSHTVGYRMISVNGRYIRGYITPKYKTTGTSNKSTGKSTTNTSTSKKSITEVAKEVLNGKWGNGSTRKIKLEAAGYDYNEVQAEVNRLSKSSTSSKKSVTEIAKEVIAGKWGNGSTRKQKLEAAGYNYNEVQKAVNKLL